MRRNVLATDIMSHPVKRLTPEATVPDAAAFLHRWGISGAPVINSHGRPIGVFSLSDIARHVQARLRRSPPSKSPADKDKAQALRLEGFADTPVRRLMTLGVYMVFPEGTVDDVIQTMTTQRVHRVFVMSETNQLLGVVTSMDVIRWLDRQRTERGCGSRLQHA